MDRPELRNRPFWRASSPTVENPRATARGFRTSLRHHTGDPVPTLSKWTASSTAPRCCLRLKLLA